MKSSGAGRQWVRQPWDPEYTPQRDISPTRQILDKKHHMSERAVVSLNVLWGMSDTDQVAGLLDGGFLSDVCLNSFAAPVKCCGVLNPFASDPNRRLLGCTGVPNNKRHRFHWLTGSVFHGHRLLSVREVVGVLCCFAAKSDVESSAVLTGLGRKVQRHLFDRLRMAATMVMEERRKAMVFENCQVEIDESVIRKEKVYAEVNGAKVRTGTWHHAVVALTKRGSTKTVLYLCKPKFVPVSASGKPSAPPLPTTSMALRILSKHLGKWVVVHTDGAEAYASAVARLKSEGFAIVHDFVVHSNHQYTAFGRHDVSEHSQWDHCDFAVMNEDGERRIRVIKGTEKIEGFWRHLKHSSAGVPEEVGHSDARLNLYGQTLCWRAQTCGDPFRDVQSMCREFRDLPDACKALAFRYGLSTPGASHKKGAKGTKLCLDLPVVVYADVPALIVDEELETTEFA